MTEHEREKMITPEEVRAKVERIRNAAGDPEAAHAYEDALYIAVLQAIAAGSRDWGVLAREALKAKDIDFDRWYA